MAVVNSEGLVTAKSAGVTIITVKAADGSGRKATCSVAVLDDDWDDDEEEDDDDWDDEDDVDEDDDSLYGDDEEDEEWE